MSREERYYNFAGCANVRDESRKSFKEFHIKFIVVVKFSRFRNTWKLNWNYITRFISERGSAFVRWKMNKRIIGKSVINSVLISTMDIIHLRELTPQWYSVSRYLTKVSYFISSVFLLIINAIVFSNEIFRDRHINETNFLLDWIYYSFNALL